MTLELALLVTVVFIFSALIKGWSGFGTNLLAMPMLLILGFLKTEAVPIVITVNIFLNIAILIENKKFKLSSLNNIMVLVVLGVVFTFVGQIFLKNSNADIIKIILGFFIILTVLNKGLKLKFTVTNKERYYIPIGIISGLLNGIAGLGGLPVLLLLSNSNMKKDEFRTTLVSYFLVMNIVAVIGFIINGLYNSLVFSYIGLVVVVSLAVCMFGVYLSRRVDDKWFQRVMLLILFALGAYTMYTGIAGLV
jgi:uncharacterized membrane protein YfcA